MNGEYSRDIENSAENSEIRVEEVKFDLEKARKTFGKLSLGLFTATVLMLVLSIAAGIFLPRELLETPWFPYVLSFVTMYVVAFPISYLFVFRLPRDSAEIPTENKMNTGTFIRLFISGAFLMYVGNLIGTAFTGFFTFFKYFLREAPSQTFSEMFDRDSLLVQIIFVSVIAPIFEELVFRKVIIDRTKCFGYMPAIIFSGVAFGFFHGNFSQFFYATLLGLLLGYIYCRTGRIVHTMLMHSAINIYGGVIPMLIFSLMDLERLDSILESPMSDEAFINALGAFVSDSILPIILYALHALVFFVLAIIGLVFLIKDRKRYKAGTLKADPPMPKGKAFTTMFVSVGFILFVCAALVEFYISL